MGEFSDAASQFAAKTGLLHMSASEQFNCLMELAVPARSRRASQAALKKRDREAPMRALVSDFLRPEKPPSPEFQPSSDWMAWCLTLDRTIAFEIFLRTANTFGVRGFAWVAWRDTAGQAQGHSWHQLNSVPVLVVDVFEIAQGAVQEFAAAYHLILQPWTMNAP